MNLILLTACLMCLGLALAFVWVFRVLTASERRQEAITLEWIDQLSATSYRPMERLLGEEDYAFLRAQGGPGPKLAKRLRGERRRVFRKYLHCLGRDFSKACMAVQVLMLHSAQDRPDLAGILLKQRLLFAVGMAAVELRLVLHTLGMGSVDVRGLVVALESMRMEVRRMVPAAALAA